MPREAAEPAAGPRLPSPVARPGWGIDAAVIDVRASSARLTYQIEFWGFAAGTRLRLVGLRDPDQRELTARFTLVVPSGSCKHIGSLPLKSGSYRFLLEEHERGHTVDLDVWASFLNGGRPVAAPSPAPRCEIAS
jgi:hypothetical protein